MARTFTSLQSEALGNDFTASVFPGTQVGAWINDGLKEVARRTDLPTTEKQQALSVVAGSAAVSLPADFIRVVDVHDEQTDELLEERDLGWLDDQPEASGIPEFYVLSGATLVFYPTPSFTSSTRLNLRFVGLPADISGATGVTGTIADDYGDLLVAYARWHLFRAEDDFELASAWEAQFEVGLRKLRMDVGSRGREHRQVPGMWGRSSAPRFVRP